MTTRSHSLERPEQLGESRIGEALRRWTARARDTLDWRLAPWQSTVAGSVHLEVDATRILLSPATVRFVAARGGRLYVWGKDAGSMLFLKGSTTEPDCDDRFRRIEAGGTVDCFIAESLIQPFRLRVELRPWPFRGLVPING